MNGWVVLSIGCYKDSEYCLNVTDLENHKKELDKLHKVKIAMSDSILVLDVGGYIGESTKAELEYAKIYSKKIYFYNDESYKQLLRITI